MERKSEKLYQLILKKYWEEGKSILLVSKEMNVPKTWLFRQMDKMAIKRRSLKKAGKLRWKRNAH